MTPTAALCLGVSLAAALWPFGRDPAGARETIGTLKPARVEIDKQAPAVDSAARAMAEYRQFLALEGTPPALRTEAMRRLADLSLEAGAQAETEAGDATAAAALYREAVTLYRGLLDQPGERPDEAAVLYQLARALEAAGDGDEALATLDRLVAGHPAAPVTDEAQFRRGETYFVRQQFDRAGEAYGAVVARGSASAFYEQSLYKQGWVFFKEARHDESLAAFLTLLDRRLGPAGAPAPDLDHLGRPERELLDDTLRVLSITFSYLEGPRSLDELLTARGNRTWNYLLYLALGDFYLEQERYRDAAGTYEAFVARDPVHMEAPRLQQAAVEAYTQGRFPSLVLTAKQQYVERYGLDAPFWAGRRPADQPVVVGHLKEHLADLADHDHAAAQASGAPADYERAAGWYRRYLAYFPEDPGSAERSFLLGELLFEARRFAEAREAYLQSAYAYGGHERAAEAGYAAILAAREHEKGLADAALAAWREQYVEQALRFAATFPAHPEAGPVLTTLAEELFAAGRLEPAIQVAGLVVTLQPPAPANLEQVAWTVLAHARFDLGRFAEAENSYQRLLGYGLAPDKRLEMETRLAASIYRQAEQAQQAGDVDRAVADYLRIATATPGAEIRPTALYDAATLLLTNARWGESVNLLQQFRRDFPGHQFGDDVTTKLAVALRESGAAAEAAVEYERVADTASAAPELRRAALWQAAELWAGAGRPADEARVYGAIVARYPEPFGEALEARHRLAELAAVRNDQAERQRWLGAIVAADGAAGPARTDRSRYLAAKATLELAAPHRDAFRGVALTAPLDRSLKLKRSRMEQALRAYGAAAAYGVAEVTTAATYETAELYYQLGRDLLASERPAGLNADELEQYEILLEEQAFPFEEQALDLYRTNADRARDGVWDEWVRASFERLAAIAPGRYARAERSADVARWLD